MPNKILFLSNLPSETNEMMLKMLFEQYVTIDLFRMEFFMNK